jgi:glucose/arabinose dehydrogenase
VSLSRAMAALALCLVATGCSGADDLAIGPPEDPPTSGLQSSPAVRPRPEGADFRPDAVRVRLRTVADGFDAPLLVANAGDGSRRLFVAEQGGRIYEMRAGSSRRGLWLDISDLTEAQGERGLLGLAFDPDFEDNGRFFVNYTNNSGDTVIAAYRTTSPHRADRSSARIVLTFDQPFPNHNGGGLAFGPDGYLYIGSGDGGSAGDPLGNGQALDTLLGKMLRIDPNRGRGDILYSVPADNPFLGREGARPEIWAYGLRNPWRFSFDRLTGELWIGDVGQSALEEIDRIDHRRGGGSNFGWNVMEGTACYGGGPCDDRDLELPVAQYGHASGCSVTGGYVYRGERYPELVGGYFFGDYCSGKIWVVDAATPGLTKPTELIDTPYALSSFGESEDGELYITDLAGGRVLQLVGA